MVAVCIATGPSADRCQPMHNGPTSASLDDCERWIADVAQPDASAIDMFCKAGGVGMGSGEVNFAR